MIDEPRQQPINNIQLFGRNMGIASQLYVGFIERNLAPHGLSYGQFTILIHLTNRPSGYPARVSDVANAVEVNQPAVTKTVQKFENLGWVKVLRDGKDHRSKRIQLTPMGYTAAQKIQQSFGPAFTHLIQGWTPEHLANLTADLGKLIKGLERQK